MLISKSMTREEIQVLRSINILVSDKLRGILFCPSTYQQESMLEICDPLF